MESRGRVQDMFWSQIERTQHLIRNGAAEREGKSRDESEVTDLED